MYISTNTKKMLVTLKSPPHGKNHVSEPLPRLEEIALTSWLEGTISVTVGCCLNPGTLRSRHQDRIRLAKDILWETPMG